MGIDVGKSARRTSGPIADLLVSRAQTTKATDPRDKVYALRGLSSDVLQSKGTDALHPDYEKALIDVYIDVVRYILQNLQPGHNQKLSILSVGYTTPADIGIWLPSWVPRWHSDRFTWCFSGTAETKAYCASKDRNVEVGFNEFRYSIFLKGVNIDRIKVVDHGLHGLSGPANRARLWKAVKNFWLSTVLPLEIPPDMRPPSPYR